MKNQHDWRETKFVRTRNGWRSNRNGRDVSPASILTADRCAAVYVDAVKRFARGRLVELGAGTAPLYGAYRDLVDSVTLVDWPGSPHETRHVDVEADISAAVPLPDSSADTVLCTDVLEHLPHPDRTFAEIERILAPGGNVLVGVPFLYGLHEEPHDHHRYTEHRLRLFARECGLEVVDLRVLGGPFEVVADVVGKTLGSAVGPRAASIQQRAASTVSRRLPNSLRRGDRLFPTGYLMVARKDEPTSF